MPEVNHADEICNKYNAGTCVQAGPCPQGRRHECKICGSTNHGAHACPNKGPQSPYQGGGSGTPKGKGKGKDKGKDKGKWKGKAK